MKKLIALGSLLIGALSIPHTTSAQLSSNPDKFLGNITTRGQVNGGDIEFADLWNQITPENESKWASVEGTRDRFNWSGCDACYNYARQHNFPFKFHCLIWGAQYPSWMDNLSTSQQYKEIVDWMDAIQERYPDLDMIDVVNEAIPGHQPAPYKNALGGDGITGYDWIIKAFEMAHERWPDAILIYNDYNTFQWNKTEFINLVKTIRDAGAPVDAYGCQSHDLTDIGFVSFKTAMKDLQNALKMPMYSSEYDIGTSDDEKQLRQYRDQIAYMWGQDYVAGITLWGYIYGATWTTDGNSGIIRNGQDRPAMTWLREYMASDEAKTAKGPYKGGVKEASVYITPATPIAMINRPCEVEIRARLRTKTIDHIDFYVNDILTETLTEAPYVVTVTPETMKHINFRAEVYDTEGNKYERLGGLNICKERDCFNGDPIEVPGIVECEDFDVCGEGSSFHDSDKVDEGKAGYRDDNEGVDIISIPNGYAIGYTAKGEWLEYTINVKQDGKYKFKAMASSGMDGSSFQLLEKVNGNLVEASNVMEVPNSGSWDNYAPVEGMCKDIWKSGEHTIRVEITGSYVNLDNIEFICARAGIDDIDSVEAGEYDVFTTTGIYLGRMSMNGDDHVSSSLLQHTRRAGVYVMRKIADGSSKLVMAK